MLQVAFSYQYQLLPNGATLGSLYTLYGEGIDAILPLYTRSAIRNVIGRHKVQVRARTRGARAHEGRARARWPPVGRAARAAGRVQVCVREC